MSQPLEFVKFIKNCMDSDEKKEKLCKFVAVKEIRAAEDEVNPLKNSLIQLNSLRRFQI